MVKVVYNGCYGGFDLSEAAVERYAELKGFRVYPQKDAKFSGLGIVTYWLVPEDQRIPDAGDRWFEMTLDEKKAHNDAYRAATFSPRSIARADPALVQVIEELGDEANGRCAKLKIEEVEKGKRYRIDGYDGFESVMCDDDYEWHVA